MLGGVGVLVVELVVAVLYGRHLFLKVQYLVYRALVFPIGVYSLIGLPGVAELGKKGLLVGSTGLLLGLEFFIGREGYLKHLLVEKAFTSTAYLVLMQVGVFLFSVEMRGLRILVGILMAILSVATKFIII